MSLFHRRTFTNLSNYNFACTHFNRHYKSLRRSQKSSFVLRKLIWRLYRSMQLCVAETSKMNLFISTFFHFSSPIQFDVLFGNMRVKNNTGTLYIANFLILEPIFLVYVDQSFGKKILFEFFPTQMTFMVRISDDLDWLNWYQINLNFRIRHARIIYIPFNWPSRFVDTFNVYSKEIFDRRDGGENIAASYLFKT